MPSEQKTRVLTSATLPDLHGAVSVPEYDRSGLRHAVVHIGVGGFHRSHLATYLDELCGSGHTQWGIVGCGVLPGDAKMADALDAQDGLYTLIVRGAASTSVRVIGSLVKYLHAWPDADKVIEQIADPDTQIVSLTVTEGGYPVDDVSGEYVASSRNAGTDSAFGILAAGLERRRLNNQAPITVMSCDNIMSNGAVARAATLGEAGAYGPALTDWIAASVSFPNSMVDRITPATADSDRQWLADEHHIDDLWPVVAEPFRQWVIADDFAGERPPLEELDVIVTDNVEPYELMKLRLLNAGHSCLAYLAALLGVETVDGAMANPAIERYVRAFLDHEAKPVLPEVAGIDIEAYIETLIERFSNPAVGDQISRLCVDGSAKFPKFLLPTVRAQLANGGPVGLSALALAAWCQYLLGSTDDGADIALSPDPLLDQAVQFAEASTLNPDAFLGFTAVFDDDLPNDDRFRAAFGEALHSLRNHGARTTIEQSLSHSHPA